MIKPGCLVCVGWNYRNRPYIDTSSDIGIAIGIPIQALTIVEKLKKKGTDWDLNIQQKITNTIAVMWPDGIMKYHAICNLVEVNQYEQLEFKRP